MEYQILFVVVLTATTIFALPTKKLTAQEIVDKINSDPKSTWKADTYGNLTLNEEFIKYRLGGKFTEARLTDFKNPENLKLGLFTEDLPTSYDAREAHPYCDSIKKIRDQSNCGSCWAVSAASTLSDRICIQTGGKFNRLLSSNYLLSCDKNCNGCEGGENKKVWNFIKENGCITGDEFDSDEGCQPYSIHPCNSYNIPCWNHLVITPKCRGTTCTNELYKSPIETDFVHVSNIYRVGNPFFPSLKEYFIRKEIYENGPVQAAFWVFMDFFYYREGIYQHKFDMYGIPMGVHVIKIIGWGEENGVKYWLAANSWGEEWGKNGLFRITRGEETCFIENDVWAGDPYVVSLDNK